MLTQIAKEVLKDVSHWIGYYENVMSDDDIKRAGEHKIVAEVQPFHVQMI